VSGLRRFLRDHEQGVLTVLAGVTYVVASIWISKALLNWIVGPLWLVAWCWGVPALGRAWRGEPVRPQETAAE
jgi:hypothetical protein